MKIIRFELFLWGSVATMATYLVSCSGAELTPNSSGSPSAPSAQTASNSPSDSSAVHGSSNSEDVTSSEPSEPKQVSLAQLETSKPYINQLLPQAARIEQEHSIPVDMTMAIAILETGWGKHVVGENNHFGLRCISDDCVARVKRGRTIRYESCPELAECFDTFAQTVNELTDGEVANVDKLAQEYASGANWARKVKKIQKQVNKILNRAREEASA